MCRWRSSRRRRRSRLGPRQRPGTHRRRASAAVAANAPRGGCPDTGRGRRRAPAALVLTDTTATTCARRRSGSGGGTLANVRRRGDPAAGIAERVRLELRRRVPLALRAAALCVAEVGVDVVGGDFMDDRPRLLLGVLVPLLAPMAPFLSLRRRGDLPPPTRLLVRRLPPDGSGSGGGGASFSPSERYMVLRSCVMYFR